MGNNIGNIENIRNIGNKISRMIFWKNTKISLENEIEEQIEEIQ